MCHSPNLVNDIEIYSNEEGDNDISLRMMSSKVCMVCCRPWSVRGAVVSSSFIFACVYANPWSSSMHMYLGLQVTYIGIAINQQGSQVKNYSN